MLKAGERPPFVVLHLEHGDHPSRMETGRIRSNQEKAVTLRSVTHTKGLPSSLSQVLVRIFLVVRQSLTPHRQKQSGFTPEKSTVYRIRALRVLTESLRDVRTGHLPYASSRRLYASPQGFRLGEPDF